MAGTFVRSTFDSGHSRSVTSAHSSHSLPSLPAVLCLWRTALAVMLSPKKAYSLKSSHLRALMFVGLP